MLNCNLLCVNFEEKMLADIFTTFSVETTCEHYLRDRILDITDSYTFIDMYLLLLQVSFIKFRLKIRNVKNMYVLM